jgi:hypothetical protein
MMGNLAITLSKKQTAVLVAPCGKRIAVIMPNAKRAGKKHIVLQVDREIKVIREKREPKETA